VDLKKILILSEAVGAGHERAAQALVRGLHEIYPAVECRVINTGQYLNPWLEKLFVKAYLETLQLTPELWGFLYGLTKKNGQPATVKNFLGKLYMTKLKKLLFNYRPDFVICTHPFPCNAMAVIKEQGYNVPTAAVVTDFDIHSLWVQHNLDAYLVGSPEVKDRLAENGIDPIRIYVTGIPINPAFVNPKNIVSIRRKIGLTEEKPVLLVMGGGLGMGRFTEIIRLLDQAPIEIQVIAITGKNQALKEELDRLADQQVKSLRVFGYVSNVEEFMAAADLIITKPGGLTSSEALAVGLPMVLVNPLPGQEEYNCRFLVEKGAAVMADTPDLVPRIVTTLFREPDKMMRMRQNALALGRPAASLDAAKLIMKTGKRKDYLYAQGT